MRLRATRTIVVEPTLPPALEPLREVAGNLHWSWDTHAGALFERADPAAWSSSGHNPTILLQGLSAERAAALATDADFLGHLDRVAQASRRYVHRRPQVDIPHASDTDVIAYFSFEFALTESLAMYSGGLGVLAGDHLKSASDLGLPLVGISLFYREGYFHQSMASDGWQTEAYSPIDPADHPFRLVRDDAGRPLQIAVPFNARDVNLQIWQLEVGGVPLFLLDPDVEGNSPEDRGVASRLYGGDIETRIDQELLLGVGGYRALRAMGLRPAVCHMNEGHSSLMAVERTRTLMEETGVSFEEARVAVAAATVFTTHTAVAAGIDLFPADLVRRHLGHYYGSLGISEHAFLGLGRINPEDETEPFSMAVLGLKLSGFRNGVSRLHGEVSRALWERAWPMLPVEQLPITSVTNGVHLPTWVSHEMGELFDRAVGSEWRDDPVAGTDWARLRGVDDHELWSIHERQRERLVERARAQHRAADARLGTGGRHTHQGPLDAAILTIGFARRFAAYKRATLLFRDPERLARLVNDPERPVQFIFAGKAHPQDEPAKQLIREVVAHARRPELKERLVVLDGYDIELAGVLVQGCDLWLNTPLRPLEASGTSGMKAVANGALHCSVLDGWWAEAYRPGLGWAIGGETVDADREAQDSLDAGSLYGLLENEVIPAFYTRGDDGVPHDWVARMKGSIAAFAATFSTHRMVGEYASRAYTPAALSWHRMRADQMAGARELAGWLEHLRRFWHTIKVIATDDNVPAHQRISGAVTVRTQVHFGELAARDVRVELLHGRATPGGDMLPQGIVTMTLEGVGEDGLCRFEGSFDPQTGGRTGYAIRILPRHPLLTTPAEPGLAVWA